MKMPFLLLAGTSVVAMVPGAAHATPRSYNLPAQPLADALQQFAIQSGEQIVFVPKMLSGKRSKRLSATLEPEVALQRLLDGSQLQYRRAKGAYVVTEQRAAELPVAKERVVPETPVAQADPAPAVTAGLDDIVVTAQKRAQNIQDVPIAISAIGSAFLESRDISSIEGLASVAPNVKIERAPSSKTISQIAIRGSVTTNPTITWEPAVGLYFDGVYIGKAQGSIFDVADLERVEVLRGPQGTLYGRNTLAGALNLITKKPTGEASGKAEISYGNYNYRRVRGALDLPAFGIFSAKVTGQIQKRDGFIDVVDNPFPNVASAGTPSVKDVSNLNSQAGMVQIRAEPSDSITVDYSFDISRFNQRPDYTQLMSVNRNGGPRDIFDPSSPAFATAGAEFPLHLYTHEGRQKTTSIDAPVREYSKTYGHALTVALDIDDSTKLKSITALRKLRWEDALDLDGTPLPVAFTERFTKYKSFSQELQLTGSGVDDRLNYVLGAYYFKDDAFTDGPQMFYDKRDNYQSTYGSDTKAYAAFGQVDYKVTDALSVTAGLRYTYEKKDIERLFRILASRSMAPGSAPITVMDIKKGDVPDATYENLTPTLIVQYEPRRDLMVYGKWARGFKSGGFNGTTTTLTELKNPYRPEKVDSFEIGLKSRLLDDSLQLNIAGFWDEHKDIQLSVFRATTATNGEVLNAGKARIRGIEIEATAKPSNALLINASFSYLDAKYDEFIEAGQNFADNRAFPHAPKYTASTSATWTAWRGDQGKLDFIGDLNWVSEYFTYTDPFVTTDPSAKNAYDTRSMGRTLVNLRATLSEIPMGVARGQISLWAQNLFNEDQPANFIPYGPGFGGMLTGFFPDPRTFGVTFGVSF